MGEMLDLRLFRLVGPNDGDHIKSHRILLQSVFANERECRAGDSLLLPEIDSFGRMARGCGTARLHFHEDNAAAIERDQVEFTTLFSGLPCEDPIPEPTQKARGNLLTPRAE
jgi:hypothetical protein